MVRGEQVEVLVAHARNPPRKLVRRCRCVEDPWPKRFPGGAHGRHGIRSGGAGAAGGAHPD
jgi:hypothetical protein